MPDFDAKNLTYDPVHGYIPFVSGAGLAEEEVSERQIIDDPWVQRMRHIHQLQTAWWVFPSAEHTRFPHIIGAMHLGSRAAEALYFSLKESCSDVPSRGYVETLLRMSGLLHDVGHGPFGHFFDEHFLKDFGLTHEILGAAIIRQRLADSLCRVRRNPNSALEPGETLDPEQIAWLIQRPRSGDADGKPRWLILLRSLLSGIYTIDNMDFVLRDALMTGYNPRAFDVDRLLHYSKFQSEGLTIHDRGVDALVRFIGVRAELFRSVYFHRTVRAIDLALKDLFVASKRWLFPGNPAERLDDYLYFTETSLLVDVQRWASATDPEQRSLGARWRKLIARQVPSVTVCSRSVTFTKDDSEQASIFSDEKLVEQKLRQLLPVDLRTTQFQVDISRTQIFRPYTLGPAEGLNFWFDSARNRIRPLNTHDLLRRLPSSQRLCRVYAPTAEHAPQIAAALDQMLGGAIDDVTNM